MSRLTATKNGINNVYQLSRVELENLVIGIIMHYNEEKRINLMDSEIFEAIVHAIRAMDGSSNDVETWWEDYYEEKHGPFCDLSTELLNYFDSRIMRCADCDWWTPVADLDSNGVCSSC